MTAAEQQALDAVAALIDAGAAGRVSPDEVIAAVEADPAIERARWRFTLRAILKEKPRGKRRRRRARRPDIFGASKK